MGQNVARLVYEDASLELVAGVIRPNADRDDAVAKIQSIVPGWHAEIVGEPERILPGVDVLVDFTNPETTVRQAKACRDYGVAIVSGTTGLNPEQMDQLQRIAGEIPVLHSASMSLGISAILEFLPALIQALPDYDVEIVESHHRYKADAPSGTALSLVRAIRSSLGSVDEHPLVFGRQGDGNRRDGEIGVHALRAGGNHGEHSVILASDDEEVTISHRSFSRLAYARGTVHAIRFIADKPAGMYTTADLLH
jgi:4-hydroxy-tetrahydrodipicolinate reductase